MELDLGRVRVSPVGKSYEIKILGRIQFSNNLNARTVLLPEYEHLGAEGE